MRRRRGRWRPDRLVLWASVLALAALFIDRAGTALIVAVPVESPQAILVLGSHEWERLPAAADQARQSRNASVFLTEPRIPTIYNCHDCGHRVDRLAAEGVERGRVVMLPLKVSNTRDEATAARAECEQRGLTRLLIVTSPYHTRRAWRIFQRAFAGSGITLGIVPAAAYSPARPAVWWKSAYDRAYVRYEWAALAHNTLLGRL